MIANADDAMWEVVWELRRIHFLERVSERAVLRRRFAELVGDERNSSLEAGERIRAEISDVGESLRLTEAEVYRLERDLSQMDGRMKEIRARANA